MIKTCCSSLQKTNISPIFGYKLKSTAITLIITDSNKQPKDDFCILSVIQPSSFSSAPILLLLLNTSLFHYPLLSSPAPSVLAIPLQSSRDSRHSLSVQHTSISTANLLWKQKTVRARLDKICKKR